MPRIQLAIADAALESTLREALMRDGAWQVECAPPARPATGCVLVIDKAGLDCAPLPLPSPERIVLVARKDPRNLSQAWNAGIVSVVSPRDPPGTILLAIMAASLRVLGMSANCPSATAASEPISSASVPAVAKTYETGANRLEPGVHRSRTPGGSIMDRSEREGRVSGAAIESQGTADPSGAGRPFRAVSREELEELVRHRICAVCSDRKTDGTCGLPDPHECALFRLFPQVAEAILRTHSDRLEDYIAAIRGKVCAVCESLESDGGCAERREVRCSLDAYLLPVVEAIEEATGKNFGRPLPVAGQDRPVAIQA